jgi:hypothetical protein
VIWIVLWALGTKAIDAFLITVGIMLGHRDREDRDALPALQPGRLTFIRA